MSEIASALVAASESRAGTVKKIKLYLLALSSLGFITLTWYLTKVALYGSQPILFWGWVLLAMMLWISSTCFFMLLNPPRWIFAFINIWGLAIYLILMPRDIYVVIGGVLFFLLSILFQKRLETDEKNQLNFSVRRSISGSLVLSTYALLVVVGFNIYYNTSEDFKRNPQKFYDQLGSAAARSIPFVSENLGPDVNLNQSLDSYIESKAEQNLPEELKDAPQVTKDIYLQEYRDQLLNQFGVNASGSETLAVVLGRITNEKAKEVLGRFERFFPLIFTLIIIGLLKGFAFIFNWLTIFVTWLLFKILLWTKFFKINKVTIEIDKLGI